MASHDAARRKTLRLRGYSYTAPGAYFVTICTHQRCCLLGDVIEEEIRLRPFGFIVREEWLRTSVVRVDASLDEYVIMPNHVHGILILKEPVGATRAVEDTE